MQVVLHLAELLDGQATTKIRLLRHGCRVFLHQKRGDEPGEAGHALRAARRALGQHFGARAAQVVQDFVPTEKSLSSTVDAESG